MAHQPARVPPASAAAQATREDAYETNRAEARRDPLPECIEIGWILAGPFDQLDLRAIREAREQLLQLLAGQLPQFSWRIPVVRRPELVKQAIVEPTELFDDAVAQRDRKRWDFSVIITDADLVAHYQSEASFFLSRSLQSAVISTSRLDPRAWSDDADNEQRAAAISRHLLDLILYAIGRWNGLQISAEMFALPEQNGAAEHVAGRDVAVGCRYDDAQLRQLAANLMAIADRRLEEEPDSQRPRAVPFYMRAAWRNRRDLLRAIQEAMPWQFPLRFSRLTTAAASAMLVMLLTAEVWDLGMNQTPAAALLLAASVIAGTTGYILHRQRLLVHRRRQRLTEQIVLTNMATVCIVLAGMTTTFVALFCVGLLLTTNLFNDSLAATWAVTVSVITPLHYVVLSGFIASLGITVGALGASFEQHHYFRHVTFVDEEL